MNTPMKRRRITAIQYHAVRVREDNSAVEEDSSPTLSQFRSSSMICRWWKKLMRNHWNSVRLYAEVSQLFKSEISRLGQNPVGTKASVNFQFHWANAQGRLILMFEKCIKRKMFEDVPKYPLFSVVSLFSPPTKIDIARVLHLIYGDTDAKFREFLNVALKNQVAIAYLDSMREALDYYTAWHHKLSTITSPAAKTIIYEDRKFADILYQNGVMFMTFWRRETFFLDTWSNGKLWQKELGLDRIKKEKQMYASYMHETLFSYEDTMERKQKLRMAQSLFKEYFETKKSLAHLCFSSVELEYVKVKTPLFLSNEQYTLNTLLERQKDYFVKHGGDEGEFLRKESLVVLNFKNLKRRVYISNGRSQFVTITRDQEHVYYTPYSTRAYIEGEATFEDASIRFFNGLTVDASLLRIRMSSLYDTLYVTPVKNSLKMTFLDSNFKKEIATKHEASIAKALSVVQTSASQSRFLDADDIILCVETFFSILDDIADWIYAAARLQAPEAMARKQMWREIWSEHKKGKLLSPDNRESMSRVTQGDLLLYGPVQYQKEVKDLLSSSIAPYFRKKYAAYFQSCIAAFKVVIMYYWGLNRLQLCLPFFHEANEFEKSTVEYEKEAVNEERKNMGILVDMPLEFGAEVNWPSIFTQKKMTFWADFLKMSIRGSPAARAFCLSGSHIDNIQKIHRLAMFSLVENPLHESCILTTWPCFLKNDLEDMRLFRRVWRWSLAYCIIHKKLEEISLSHSRNCLSSHVQYHSFFQHVVCFLVMFPHTYYDPVHSPPLESSKCMRPHDDYLYMQAAEVGYDHTGNSMLSKLPGLLKRKPVHTGDSIIVGLDPYAVDKTIALGINCMKDLASMSTDPKTKDFLRAQQTPGFFKALQTELETRILGTLPTLLVQNNPERSPVWYMATPAPPSFSCAQAILTREQQATLDKWRKVWLDTPDYRAVPMAIRECFPEVGGFDMTRRLICSVVRFDRICKFNFKCYQEFYASLFAGVN